MEGKSQNTSGSASVPKSAGSLKPLQQGVGGSGAIPTNTSPQIAGGSGQTTVTLSLEPFKMFVQAMKPDADANLLLAQMGVIPTPPPAVDVQMQETRSGGTVDGNEYTRTERMRMGEAVEQGEEVEQQLPGAEKGTEEPTVQQDEVLEVVRQINAEAEPSSIAEVSEEIQAESIPMGTATVNEPMEEAEQALLTLEEVAANLAARSSEAAETNMEVDGDRTVEWHHTERAEIATDETPGDREVVIVTDEREETKQAPPRDEAARARAATVHMYQRRPAREETSGRKPTEEQLRETPGQKTEGGVDSPARSVVVPPRRRRRLLIDEEPEEEDDIFFTPVDALPSSGQPDPPAEVEDSERDMRERKIKGNAVAALVKKKPRQASSTLVIQEGRQRIEEDDNEEEEALRMERRSKERNDGARNTSEQRPEMASIQFKKMQVRLDNDLHGQMITFDDPKLTKECEARIGRGKKARSKRRLNQEALEELETVEDFMEFITGIAFDWLLVPSSPKMPIELAQEFFN